jgi:hypothetical protein
MGQRIRSSPARCLAVLVAPLLVLGCGSPGTSVSAGGYVQQAELTALGTAGGEFGLSVALSASGTTALAGDPGTVVTNGAAYVLTRRGGTWSRSAELTASDGTPGDAFGFSVALSASGTTALVGAYMHNATTGAAYVFTLRGGTWSQTAELTASDRAPGVEFGRSVALSASGATALVGAPDYDAGTGAAYVFTLRGGSWSQTAELTASDGAQGGESGFSVALSASGGTALVGALVHHADTGAAYVFTLRRGTWSRTGELTASDGARGDEFGLSVALSALGTTALAGASQRNAQTGAVYVFTLRGGTWTQTAELTATGGKGFDQFGVSVALSASGTTALAGAPGRNSGAGAAYVFRLRRGTWTQAAELTASHRVRYAAFGCSVALSLPGTTALIGAALQSAAYVFTGGSPG